MEASATVERKLAARFVVAGGDAPEVLDPAEGVFDPVAFAVAGLVVDDLAFAGDPAGDDRHGSGLAQRPS